MRNIKTAILLVSSHSTIVLVGADQQHEEKDWIFYLQGIVIRVFVVIVPSVTFQRQIMKETSVFSSICDYRRSSPFNHGKLQSMQYLT